MKKQFLYKVKNIVDSKGGIARTLKKGLKILIFEGLNGVKSRINSENLNLSPELTLTSPNELQIRLRNLKLKYLSSHPDLNFFLTSRVQLLPVNFIDTDIKTENDLEEKRIWLGLYIENFEGLKLARAILQNDNTKHAHLFINEDNKFNDSFESFNNSSLKITVCNNPILDLVKIITSGIYDKVVFLNMSGLLLNKKLTLFFKKQDWYNYFLLNISEQKKVIFYGEWDTDFGPSVEEKTDDFLLKFFNTSSLGECPYKNISFILDGKSFSMFGLQDEVSCELKKFNFWECEKILLKLSLSLEGTIHKMICEGLQADLTLFEQQETFPNFNLTKDIKVLAYYLPQFHPTKENDKWHGKGFTEWTKVSNAKPLFPGHYQPRIPHPDIGYYHLDSSDILKKQAKMMKTAGIDGLLFYHYWFTGKLILEQPAQLLLEDKTIDLPFAFCWANENWTKRWDGDENDILLEQKYSAEDAKSFIRYLIPFFKDNRYIKILNRPLLAIYRASHVTNLQEYINIWNKECNLLGVPNPYIAIVLTRGAKLPSKYNVDAGIERPLHDWTGGKIKDWNYAQSFFKPFIGSVLSYRKVARFYSSSKLPSEKIFRCVIPSWDNTARYDDRAYVLHQSDPSNFQSWCTKVFKEAEKKLPENERFVIVNAWNEWAEGDYLEPDEKFGYAYLNALGRARSGYVTRNSIQLKNIENFYVCFKFQKKVIQILEKYETLRQRFIKNIFYQFKEFPNLKLISNYKELESYLPIVRYDILTDFSPNSIVVHIDRVFFEPKGNIIKSLELALNNSGNNVVPDFYSSNIVLSTLLGTESLVSAASFSPYSIFYGQKENSFPKYKVNLGSHAFVLDTPKDSESVISVIIRIHSSADIKKFSEALCSLQSVVGCRIKPVIAAQDFTAEGQTQLSTILTEAFDWEEEPLFIFFKSKNKEDLRSLMLNQSLLSIKTRYVAFLDYDDLIFSEGYSWLIERLSLTKKGIAFGRVYRANVSSSSNRFIERTKVWLEKTKYEDFIVDNFIPLHSFILDLNRVNVKNVKYFETHKYMEDYYLLLQLVTKENTDWKSLSLNHFIGDYRFDETGENTLAVEIEKVENIINNKEFIECLERINTLKKNLIKH